MLCFLLSLKKIDLNLYTIHNRRWIEWLLMNLLIIHISTIYFIVWINVRILYAGYTLNDFFHDNFFWLGINIFIHICIGFWSYFSYVKHGTYYVRSDSYKEYLARVIYQNYHFFKWTWLLSSNKISISGYLFFFAMGGKFIIYGFISSRIIAIVANLNHWYVQEFGVTSVSLFVYTLPFHWYSITVINLIIMLAMYAPLHLYQDYKLSKLYYEGVGKIAL